MNSPTKTPPAWQQKKTDKNSTQHLPRRISQFYSFSQAKNILNFPAPKKEKEKKLNNEAGDAVCLGPQPEKQSLLNDIVLEVLLLMQIFCLRLALQLLWVVYSHSHSHFYTD